MPLAEISTIPQTTDDLRAWSFAHMANHRDILRIVNTNPGINGSVTPTFSELASPNQDDYQLTESSIVNAGTGYWQGATGAWSADVGSNGWFMNGAPTIQFAFTQGKITQVGFTAASSNPGIVYETSAPNVGVLPSIVVTGMAKAILTEYPLDPIDLANFDLWLYHHQVMHSQMDAVLGIAGYNLLELDWNDPDQLQSWIAYNLNEHVQASQELGLG